MLQLISNANVFAPAPMGVCHILVAGRQIVYIGAAEPELNTPLEVETTDLNGAYVVPGIIDAHAHITGGGGESGPDSRVPPVHLSAFTTAGVTSVVGVLGTDDLTRNTQTLVTQAYGLRALGLSAWCHTGGYHYPLTTLTGTARGDIVFIDPVIGVGELALSDHRSSQPTLDEFLRVASEAHVAGLMTGKAGIVHCHMGDGERGLGMVREALEQSEIPARVFNPTHVNRNKVLFEEALALTERGCSIDLTAFPKSDIGPGYSAAEAFLRYHASDHLRDRLTMSSDGGGCLPHFDADGSLTHMGIGSPSTLIETVRELTDANIPLNEILPPVTSNVADILKLSSKGRLECGKDADLLVLNDRHQIQDVMCMGRWHVRDGSAVIVGPYESG
jgi:beta-aspartyl-dipeptidase (metallo-type)